ncbi:hypothetical protein TRFO_37047 [Tritrichomonas foetus]|uniref:Leucine Rich Repeat family protein n=1 Tax=Tritrichomonas foetus TaxID=1144522 RepID=A0A1J4JEL6_9EUKA|nr:hypothetical protein TRFO_37047 [Tritrichomonas foetus]|eukprot:OHS96735.1 hypothetical protein TRFO_37047 [Tritrichomonas foetus]
MEVDENLLDSVRSIVTIGPYERVISCTNITHYAKHNKKVKAIMLFTDFCFYVLEKTTFSKTFSIAGEARWNDIAEIKYFDKTTFSISNYSNIIKVGHPMGEYFLKLILNHIKNILIPTEMPEFVNLGSILRTIEHSHDAFIERFKFQLRLSNNPDYPSELIKELSKLICRVPELDIPSLPSADQFTDVLLNCCQVEPTIRSVIIPQGLRTPYWTPLANCLRKNTTLVHVQMQDPFNNEFSRVIEALEKNHNTFITKFTFIQTHFTHEHFHLLLRMMQAIPFTELSFDNAISGEDFLNLLDFESVPFAMTSLRSLTFKNTRNLPIKDIIYSIPSIQHLALINCSTDLDSLLEVIPKSKLETVNIVGGITSEELHTNIKLPPSLWSITFDKVKWSSNTFSRVWKLCIDHKTTERKKIISFASAGLNHQQWAEFFKLINPNGNPDLIELNWSENPFEPQILHFLMKCPLLKTLKADGCFSPDCPSIQDFTDFLTACNRITTLSMKGTEKAKLQGAAELMFNGLKKNKKLVDLDVSDNDFGDAGILALSDLLVSNKKIAKIRFSNNNVETGEAYYQFFNEVKDRGPKLDIIYPDKEIYRMHKAKLLRGKAVNYIQDCYAIILSGNLKVKVNETFSSSDSSDEDENNNSHNNDFNDNRNGNAINGGMFGNMNIFGNIKPPDPINEESSSNEQQNGTGSSVMIEDWILNLPNVPLPDIKAQMVAIANTYNTPLLISRARSV